MFDAMFLLLLMPAFGVIGQVRPEPGLSGTFRPSAAPEEPVRRMVGSGCVVDFKQAYDVKGSLVGEMIIDFRIFVDGDCTKPPGTYDEHWISYGTYVFRLQGKECSGSLIYLATVQAGGEVEGVLTLDGELSAELNVRGHFENGYMSYSSAQAASARR